MVRTALAIAFIASAAITGIVVACRPTVIRGEVMAADLLGQLKDKNSNVAAVTCDPEIPLGRDGAVFTCTTTRTDGSSARAEYTMSRSGALTYKVFEPAPGTE